MLSSACRDCYIRFAVSCARLSGPARRRPPGNCGVSRRTGRSRGRHDRGRVDVEWTTTRGMDSLTTFGFFATLLESCVSHFYLVADPSHAQCADTPPTNRLFRPRSQDFLIGTSVTSVTVREVRDRPTDLQPGVQIFGRRLGKSARCRTDNLWRLWENFELPADVSAMLAIVAALCCAQDMLGHAAKCTSANSTCWPSARAFQELARSLDGELYTRNSIGWHKVTHLHNSRMKGNPAVAVAATSASDVQAVVSFAW